MKLRREMPESPACLCASVLHAASCVRPREALKSILRVTALVGTFAAVGLDRPIAFRAPLLPSFALHSAVL